MQYKKTSFKRNQLTQLFREATSFRKAEHPFLSCIPYEKPATYCLNSQDQALLRLMMRSAFTSPATVARGVMVMSWKRRLKEMDCVKRKAMMKFIPKDQPRSTSKIKFLDQLTGLRKYTLPTNLEDFAISTTLPHSESAVREGFYISGNSGGGSAQGTPSAKRGTLVYDQNRCRLGDGLRHTGLVEESPGWVATMDHMPLVLRLNP